MAKQPIRWHLFELYILSESLTQGQWLQLNKAIIGHLGVLGGNYDLVFRCTDNVVRFFVRCDHDLSMLSNAIEGVLLRPAHEKDLELPSATGKEHFVQFVSGGNILDLKEKYHIKKMKSLEFASFRVKAFRHDKAVIQTSMYFMSVGKAWSKATKLLTAFPANLLAIDFTTNTHYLKKTVPKYLNIEKAVPILSSDSAGALLEVDTFPFFPRNYYLHLTGYEFDKHSFIVGASGSGKSKFISLLVDRLSKTALAMNYRVVVIDPHASLAEDFTHIADKKVINFGHESTELFSGTATDISAATELTGTLFRSLMGDMANPKADRLLRFSLYVLLTAQAMSLGNLKRFVTDIELRNQILEHVESYVPSNIIHFFGADFNELRTKYYTETISPIVSFVDEMQLQPALISEGELSLSKTIQEHFLTVFSLNKVSMGEKVVKTVAGLLIQQIFLLAQARAFNQRVMLIIDEVSVVQNPALAAILSEARKFNLTVVLTQQYFGQIDKDLRDAIFANTYNYYTFKVSEEDARALEGNLNIELPKELVEKEHAKGIDEPEVRVKIMTELHPRECLVRVLANGQVVPAVKARTLDAPHAEKSISPDNLATYQTSPSPKLPTKFEESQVLRSPVKTAIPGENAPEPPVTVASTPLASAPQGLETAAPTPPRPFDTASSLEPQTFNLSDLLAEHSSSRIKVRKDG